jgi:hypothetical protein
MKVSILSGGLKAACFGVAVVAGASVTPAAAQASASDQVHLNVSGATVPTTKILAVGRWTPNATVAGVAPPPRFATQFVSTSTALSTKWFVQQDNSGVVFLLNVTDPDRAHELLENLPLARAGAMEFQLTPLGPISLLGVLLPEPSK